MAFLFGYCWSVLRPIAFELNRRMVEAGIFEGDDDAFFCVTEELSAAIEARKAGGSVPGLSQLAAERRMLLRAASFFRAPSLLHALGTWAEVVFAAQTSREVAPFRNSMTYYRNLFCIHALAI